VNFFRSAGRFSGEMSCLMGGAFPDRPSRDLHDLDTDEEEEAFNTVERVYGVDISGSTNDIELLVVSDTKISRDCLRVYLYQQEDAVIGKVTETLKQVVTDDPDMKPEKEPEDKTTSIATLTRITGGVCHCDFSSSPNSEHINEVAEQVTRNFSNEHLAVVILTSKNVSEYQRSAQEHGDETPEVVTKWLKSSKFSQVCGDTLSSRDRLEQPNMVGGLPAAFLAKAEVSGKPCSLLVTYTDVDRSDSITMSGLREMFFKTCKTKFGISPVNNKTSADRLKKLFSQQDSGHIFM